MSSQIYRIPEENIKSLQKKINSINNKSNKLVGNSIIVNQIGEEFIQDKNTKEYNKIIIVEIQGEAPHYDGWEFVATLNHNYDGGNIVKTAGEQIIPEEYRTAPIKCDHCGVNRFRKDTYVVRNVKSNEYKQIGSSCLKDFFNGRDPHSVAKYAGLLFELTDQMGDFEQYSRPTKYIQLKEYLNIVNELIKKYNFMGSKKADEIAEQTGTRPITTAQEAYNQIIDIRLPYNKRIKPTTESEVIVDKALEWINGQPIDSEYMHNLQTICRNEYVDYKGIGIAASLIPTYCRSMNEQKDIGEKKEGRHIGTEGHKIVIAVTLEKIFSYETIYGITKIYKFTDEEGNVLIWKTSPRDLEEDKKYKIEGTVKNHEIYNGEKQTQLTRCKIKEEV